MAKLLKSGGATRDWGDAIVDGGDHWLVTRADGYSAKWPKALGSFSVEDGPAPSPPAPVVDAWAGTRPQDPDLFPALCAAAIGAAKFDAIKRSPKTSWIIDVVMAPTQREIDPADRRGNFRKIVAFLRGQTAWGTTPALASPADDAILLTAQDEAALIAAFKT